MSECDGMTNGRLQLEERSLARGAAVEQRTPGLICPIDAGNLRTRISQPTNVLRFVADLPPKELNSGLETLYSDTVSHERPEPLSDGRLIKILCQIKILQCNQRRSRSLDVHCCGTDEFVGEAAHGRLSAPRGRATTICSRVPNIPSTSSNGCVKTATRAVRRPRQATRASGAPRGRPHRTRRARRCRPEIARQRASSGGGRRRGTRRRA